MTTDRSKPAAVSKHRFVLYFDEDCGETFALYKDGVLAADGTLGYGWREVFDQIGDTLDVEVRENDEFLLGSGGDGTSEYDVFADTLDAIDEWISGAGTRHADAERLRDQAETLINRANGLDPDHASNLYR